MIREPHDQAEYSCPPKMQSSKYMIPKAIVLSLGCVLACLKARSGKGSDSFVLLIVTCDIGSPNLSSVDVECHSRFLLGSRGLVFTCVRRQLDTRGRNYTHGCYSSGYHSKPTGHIRPVRISRPFCLKSEN